MSWIHRIHKTLLSILDGCKLTASLSRNTGRTHWISQNYSEHQHLKISSVWVPSLHAVSAGQLFERRFQYCVWNVHIKTYVITHRSASNEKRCQSHIWYKYIVQADLQLLLSRSLRCWIIGILKYNFLLLTFLKMFIPRSVERSGTAGLRKLVIETLENASALSDFSSSLHFIVRSCSSQKKTVSTRRNRG